MTTAFTLPTWLTPEMYGDRILRWDDYLDNTTPEGLDALYMEYFDEVNGDFSPDDFIHISLTVHGDYVGSSVEESNYNVMLDELKDNPDVFPVYGGFGGKCLAVRLSALEDVREMLENLSNYCVLDEEELSKVERRREDEMWNDCYSQEFKRGVQKMFCANLDEDGDYCDEDTCPICGMSDEHLYNVLCVTMDRQNEQWIHETGDSVYLNVENLLNGIRDEDVQKGLRGDRW